jgi:hypothetical protein
MNHTVKKIPVPTGWEKLMTRRQVGRPSSKHLTVAEYANLNNRSWQQANNEFKRLLKAGKITVTQSIYDGHLTNFYAPN